MANKHNQHIYSPIFSEYAYRALKNTTYNQRVSIEDKYQTILNDDYKLQKFCKEERMDHVMYVLTLIGISWTFRIDVDSFAGDMVEFGAADQEKYPQKQVDNINATAREGVCVISSREVMNWSHQVSQNCTNKVYAISEFNAALEKKGKDFQQLKTYDMGLERVQKAHDTFNSVLLEQLNTLEYALENMDMEPNEIRLLCALYKRRQSAISMTEIATITRASGKRMYFRPELESLLSKNLVTTDIKDIKKKWPKDGYFMISTRGIGKIMEYRELVLKYIL